jgi:PEP-CTERM motif
MTTHRMLVTSVFSCFVLFIVVGNANAASVGAVESGPNGAAVTVGNVPVDPTLVISAILSNPTLSPVNGFSYSSWAFLANDGTGSVDIFGKMPLGSSYIPTVGDDITASGTYSNAFSQIPELSSLTSIGASASGQPYPGPAPNTIPTLNVSPQTYGASGTAEFLWNLNNVTISSGTGSTPTILTPGETWGNSATGTAANMTLTVSDGTNSMTLFYWPTSYSSDAAFYGQTIPQGTPVNITGFTDVFTSAGVSTPEFVPYLITPVPEPSAFVLGGLSLVGLLGVRKARRVKKGL